MGDYELESDGEREAFEAKILARVYGVILDARRKRLAAGGEADEDSGVLALTPAHAQRVDESRLVALGDVADEFARADVFDEYRRQKSENTLKRHDRDLRSFTEYLAAAGVRVDPRRLASEPEAWAGVSFGLVEGFKRWLLQQGYAVSTVNARLSTVRVYAGLAHDAGALDEETHSRLQRVGGYNAPAGRRLDEKRAQTRLSAKKAEPTRLSVAEARALKDQPLDTPQGRRDAVLMCLLLDHGLRVGELADLRVGDVDLAALELRFYREKVGKTQTHQLRLDSARALNAWFGSGDAPADGGAPLLRGSRKGGALTRPGMSRRAIRQRVRVLGEALGVENLSPHDCRHFWATLAARSGTDAFALKQAGGWTSMATVDRYVDESAVANAGVKLEGADIAEGR